MRKLSTMLIAMGMAIVLAFGLAACGETLALDKTSAELTVGEKLTLKLTDGKGNEVTDAEWTSSDTEVATVTSRGGVSAQGAGSATITAKKGSASATCALTVKAREVVVVEITDGEGKQLSEASVEKGGTLVVKATTSDNSTVKWSVSDEKYATVKGDGNTATVTGILPADKAVGLKLYAMSGSTRKEIPLTVTWSEMPADYYEIPNGGETDAAANPDKFYEWHDQNWVGSNVTVSTALHYNGTVYISFSGNTAQWYGFQLFYKNSGNVVGTNYNLTCKIKAETAGDITVCGTVVHLNAGDNDVSVFYTETALNVNNEAAASLSLQAGVNGGAIMESNTFEISALKFSEYTSEKLKTPTGLSIAADKTVTVTDGNGANASAFKLAFCIGDDVKYNRTLHNGDKIDDTVMEDGVYDVKVQAVGQGKYTDSDLSGVLATYTVQNGGVSYDLYAGGETDAVANPGAWYYWTEFSGIVNAKYEKGAVTYDCVNGGNWYSNQIFYKNPALKAGVKYRLAFNFYSTVAVKATVDGTVIELKADAAVPVSVEYTEGAGNASVSIQMGVQAGAQEGAQKENVCVAEGSYKLSDFVWTEVEGSEQPTPPAPAGGLVFGEETSEEARNGWAYWNDQNWTGSNVTVTETKLEKNADGSYAIAVKFSATGACNYGFQIFYNDADHQAGKQYTLTLTVTAKSDCRVTINGKAYELKANEATAVEVTFTYEGDLSLFDMQVVVADGQSYDLTLEDIKWTAVEGGSEQPTPQPGITVTLSFEMEYGDMYLQFNVETSAPIAQEGLKIKVNGVETDWFEWLPGAENHYIFKVKVGDLSLSSYTFEWVQDGQTVATATYTPAK